LWQVIRGATFHFAREAGLTSAIVHSSKILSERKIEPDGWKLASDLVYDRRTFA
jgi:5-methyltetrahydrofolate--homocysteine methyltransferase